MISSTRQLAEFINWRPVLVAGLLVLSAFLINLAGSTKAIAFSPASGGHIHAETDRSDLRATRDQADFCHHISNADTIKTVSSTGAHPIHGNAPQHEKTGKHEKHNCQSCCPLDNAANASAILRSRHDGVQITALHHSEKSLGSSFAAIGSPPVQVGHRSQSLTSQLTGLSGAQVAFLHTVRLLT